MKTEALRFVRVSADDYAFGGLKDASFCLYRGETIALAGLLNSGHITIMRILSGYVFGYGGDIEVLGQRVKLEGYTSVHKSHIASIQDARHLFGNMSLYDNVHISQLEKGLFSRVGRNKKSLAAQTLSEALEIDFSKKNIDQLSSFEKTKLEILKGFVGGAQIFVFSSIAMYCNEQEAQQLAGIVRVLNELGAAVILGSDDYFPIFEDLIERCIVVRSGVVTTTIYKNQSGVFDDEAIRHAIVGRSFGKRPGFAQQLVQGFDKVPFLSLAKRGGTPPLEVKRGAIIGLYDAEDYLPKTVGDLLKSFEETYCVLIDGQPFAPKTVEELIGQGVAVITKEASDKPIFFNLSPVENVCIFARRIFGEKVLYNKRVSNYLYDTVIKRYSVFKHCVELKNRKNCYDLSYQQQYELMIAKWLAINPRIIVIYAPLSNIDTKTAERYKELHAGLSEEGKTQIIISSSYDSLESVCTEIIQI